MRLYDVIQACSCQIIFIGGGVIASSATWIMAGADKRLLYPNTKILIHDGPSGVVTAIPAKAIDLAIDADDQAKIQKRLNEIYAKNSRMPVEFWTEFTKRDLWLSAEEAIMLGLADEIIEPKKRGNLRKSRIAALKNNANVRGLKSLVKTIKDRVYANKNITLEIKLPEEEFDKNLTIDPTPETIQIVDKDILATIKE
jgi:enoyl-CoA hydratase/carnithine racemase